MSLRDLHHLLRYESVAFYSLLKKLFHVLFFFQKTSHVSDALARMYDFDDHPDRRKFLDQLLRFMEEKGSPITACPTISKNPLDLFRLYLLVRDRGGFVEVTKNKVWKDIAQTLGIGASSSAAYTLRKHYTKSLFPWECKFDRGGVDPQPILNQVRHFVAVFITRKRVLSGIFNSDI